MKLAIDVDGVLAEFDGSFAALLEEQTGRPCRILEPDRWEWPHALGFSKPEEERAWQYISEHPNWWATLQSYEDSDVDFRAVERDGHDIYFVTARRTPFARFYTANWLRDVYTLYDAAVILSNDKGLICRALRIDAFLDDRPEHCIDVRLVSPKTKSYLRKRSHNAMAQKYVERDGVILTDSVETFIKDLNL